MKFEGDEKVYKNHFGCCTFATRRKNKRRNIPRLELSFAQKNKWEDDWLGHWFYARVEIRGVGTDFRFAATIAPIDVLTTPSFTQSSVVSKCEAAYRAAAKCIIGRDLVEEYIASAMWPLLAEFSKPFKLEEKTVSWKNSPLIYPCFEVESVLDTDPVDFVREVEQ